MKGFLIFLLVCLWAVILVLIYFGITFTQSKKECETKESPKCPQLVCGDTNAASQTCGDEPSKCYASRKENGKTIYNYAPYDS